MSTKIASLYAEIGTDTSKAEAGFKKTKSGLDQQAQAFAKFSADATRNAKSFVAYEAQKAKAIAATERAAAKFAKEEERAAKAAAKAAEAQRKASLSIAPGFERGTKSLQEFTAANAGLFSVATVAAGALIGVGVAIDKQIEKVVQYGDEVQKLKTITGQSAEATSNTIQLADDARVSYEKLTVALQFASKKGIDTSIGGLAKLSEQYKALAPGIERTKFLTDTFGKSGVDMAKILEMDSAAIKNFKANAGQILTEADLRQIKAYNVALDSMKDGFEGLGNSVGKAAMPLKTDLINGVNVFSRAMDMAIKKNGLFGTSTSDFIKFTDIAGREIWQEQQAMLSAGDASEGFGDDLDGLAEKQEAAKEAAKRLSDTYGGLLSAMFSIQKESDNYEKKTADLAKKEQELIDKKGNLAYQMSLLTNKERDAGEQYTASKEKLSDYITQIDQLSHARSQAMNEQASLESQGLQESERYIELKEQIKDYDSELKSLDKSKTKLATTQKGMTADYEKWLDLVKESKDVEDQLNELSEDKINAANELSKASKQREYDLARERLSVDGLTSDEFEGLQQVAVQKGLVSRAAADQAIAESRAADMIIDSMGGTVDSMNETLKAMEAIRAQAGQVNFSVNFQSNVPQHYNVPGANYSTPNPQASPGGYGYHPRRDSGGAGIAGEPYMIGVKEIFVPENKGEFIPLGGANAKSVGNTTIINITNPKREAAENSIRAALKKLSYVGVVA